MEALLLICKGFMKSVIKYFLEITKYMNNLLAEYSLKGIFAILIESTRKVSEV